MTFEWPALLWLLALVPLAVALLAGGARRRDRQRRAYADPHLLSAAFADARPGVTRWPLALQLGALTLLLLGAAQPVAPLRVPVNQAAVMIALDTSRSMLADDVRPTRLAAAGEVVREFLRVAPASTRIGFLTFSDRTAVLVAPTTDRQAVLDALERVKPAQATSLSGALVGAVRALPGRGGATVPPELDPAPGPGAGALPGPAAPTAAPQDLPPGAVLLLSDGISNRGGNPLIAARFASTQAVKVSTVALGREGGAVSQIEGQLVFVPFDSGGLRTVAQVTGGAFLEGTDPEALRGLFRDLGRAVRWTLTPLDLAAPLSGAAAALLVVGGLLGLRWQRRVP